MNNLFSSFAINFELENIVRTHKNKHSTNLIYCQLAVDRILDINKINWLQPTILTTCTPPGLMRSKLIDEKININIYMEQW